MQNNGEVGGQKLPSVGRGFPSRFDKEAQWAARNSSPYKKITYEIIDSYFTIRLLTFLNSIHLLKPLEPLEPFEPLEPLEPFERLNY